jgi:hypothetical protein
MGSSEDAGTVLTGQSSPCLFGPAGFAAVDLAGRPGIDRLHIDAYPSRHLAARRRRPAPAAHTTFAVRFRPAPAGQS